MYEDFQSHGANTGGNTWTYIIMTWEGAAVKDRLLPPLLYASSPTVDLMPNVVFFAAATAAALKSHRGRGSRGTGDIDPFFLSVISSLITVASSSPNRTHLLITGVNVWISGRWQHRKVNVPMAYMGENWSSGWGQIRLMLPLRAVSPTSDLLPATSLISDILRPKNYEGSRDSYADDYRSEWMVDEVYRLNSCCLLIALIRHLIYAKYFDAIRGWANISLQISSLPNHIQ